MSPLIPVPRGGIASLLTDEIMARLSQVQGLRVMSRYATMRYRGGAVDPRTVGRDLGVRYVLQGTMRRVGDRMRVVVEITDATGGFNLWAQTYERPVADMFGGEYSATLRDRVGSAVLEIVR